MKLEDKIKEYVVNGKEVELLDLIFIEYTGHVSSDKEIKALRKCESKCDYLIKVAERLYKK